MLIRPRPFLCPQPDIEGVSTSWAPSSDNAWWSPVSSSYLSSDLLLPGDVLLFAPQKPSPSQRGIQKAQKMLGSAEEHSQFTHAALYLGLDHLICESTPFHGVTYSTLEQRLGANCLLVRRVPGLALKQRLRIANKASILLGLGYGWGEPIVAGTAKVLFSLGVSNKKVAAGLLCSRVCDRAIVSALVDDFPTFGTSFHPNRGALVTPAVLSETKKLLDVDLTWRLAGMLQST